MSHLPTAAMAPPTPTDQRPHSAITGRPFHERVIGVNHELALEEAAGAAKREDGPTGGVRQMVIADAHHAVIDEVHAAFTGQTLADVTESQVVASIGRAFAATADPAKLARLITTVVAFSTEQVTA